MLELGDFAAYISVDGKELAQYGSEVLPGEGTVTCWVASEAGKVGNSYFFLVLVRLRNS